MSRPSIHASPLSVLLAASLALVVAEVGVAQTQVQPNRVGTQVGGTQVTGSQARGARPAQSRSGNTYADYTTGRGQGLGDGNALGGQTFRWSQTIGAGQVTGSGNVLDANPQLGSGGANAGSVPVDFNARNLLITGSVPGGRGFRGSVGYTADTDFRARTGSDDNYLFRANSAFSSPAFVSSPVARDRFLIGQGLGVFEYRRESTPLSRMDAANDQPESRLRLDRVNAQMSFGRGNWDIGADRTIISTQSAKGEPLRYVISPLRGLQVENLTDPFARAGLSVYERARARQDMVSGYATMDDYAGLRTGMSLQTPDPRRVDKRLKAESAADRLRVKGLPKSYLDIVDEINKAGEATGTTTDGTTPAGTTPAGEAKSNLERIREAMEPLRTRRPGEDGRDEGKPDFTTKPDPTKPDPRKPDSGTSDPTKPSTGAVGSDSLISSDGAPRSGEAEREAERVKQRGIQISVDDAARILRHGKKVDSLSVDDKRRVDELIRQGETALRDGDYFRAERRFDQAQSLAADNPLVEAGIAHAQLGAGLYLSASLTLRNLFTAFPELIDAKYDRALLPAQDRLDRGVALMRQRIDRGDDAPGYGLLLAYIGHQTGDRAMVAEGLKAIGGNEKLDTSRQLLEAVWLGSK
jgi:hypothetical protein